MSRFAAARVRADRIERAQADADALAARVCRKAAAASEGAGERQAEYDAAARRLRRSMTETRSHRDVTDSGTAGTRRQRSDSGLRSMAAANLIWSEMQQAAQEIEQVFHAQTAGLMIRAIDYAAAGGRSNAEQSTRLSDAYVDHYKPWADELSAAFKAGGRPALAIVISIVIDDMTLTQAEQDYRMRRTTIQFIVRRSLLRYAAIAGWVAPMSVVGFDRSHPDEARAARVLLPA